MSEPKDGNDEVVAETSGLTDSHSEIAWVCNFERAIVLKNPEAVGINFDHRFVVDGRSFWTAERYLRYFKERDGEVSSEIMSYIESGEASRLIEDRKAFELGKIEDLKNYLAGFGSKLKHVRVHPAGELSPLTPSQAVEQTPEGDYRVSFPPEYIDQLKLIKENSADLTLVAQFYDHRRGTEMASDVPETPLQRSSYIDMCREVVRQVGEDIQLEIGNETNVTRGTDERFDSLLQHASQTDPVEYARFYFEVASKLKQEFPSLKLSVAGVACFDPSYLSAVMEEIRRLEVEGGINEKVVDTISFHPYREKPDDGSVEVKHGQFSSSGLNFDEQVGVMKELAGRFGVKLTVGEINFRFEDTKQGEKLETALGSTSAHGLVSLIYPGMHCH